jgi:hypothetical protein
MSPDTTSLLASIDPVKLLQIISMPEAERLSGLSHDTLKRRHSSKIIRLSPRRVGMRLIDVLSLGEAASNNT